MIVPLRHIQSYILESLNKPLSFVEHRVPRRVNAQVCIVKLDQISITIRQQNERSTCAATEWLGENSVMFIVKTLQALTQIR